MDAADRVADALGGRWNVVAVAVEGYEDFGPHKRGALNRWTTPAVAALIGAKLASLAYAVVWQSPHQVMRAYAEHKAAWEKGLSLIAGDDKLTNDHVRSACAHALACRASRRMRGA